MVAVSELVSGLDAELVRLGYKPSTMVWYRGCWRRLEGFFASRGVREFSLDVAMAWVDQACGGFFDKEQAGTLKATDVYLFRVAQMLDDFAVHGAVLRRYSRTVDKLTAEQADVLARFQAWLQAAGCAVSTVRAYGTVAGEFLAFTGTRGGLAGLDAAGRSTRSWRRWPATRPRRWSTSCAPCGRSCGSPPATGWSTPAVLEAVPAAKSTQAGQDPVGVGPGRRDQDPAGDRPRQPVRQTRLRDHPADHPARAARHRRQTAAVRRSRLARQPALGGAGQDRPAGAAAAAQGRRLGDHRLHPARPPGSDCPQVFLRHTAPIGPFSDQDHLHQILVKHARAAHVPLGEKRRHGMHSLRHTLATRLLEDGTPVEQIADILGHQSGRVHRRLPEILAAACWPGAPWTRTRRRREARR